MMPRQCNRSWAETVPDGHRNDLATKVLRHGCILVADHVDKDGRPSPCHCTCDPVYELRTDFAAFVKGGVFARGD